MEKEFLIWYDDSKPSSCMVITERKGSRTLCINHVHGSEADELFNQITAKEGKQDEDF